MVRRVELRRIDDELSRQLSFAKRRNGIIKKALELFVVCGVDCIFIAFSPSGRLSYFFGDKRVEEVLARFVAIPEHIRPLHLSEPEYQELVGILNELKERTDEQLRNDRTVVAIQREIAKAKAELESVTSEISKKYKPNLDSVMTIEEATISEATLEDTLARVQQRMKQLSENHDKDASQSSGYKIGGGEAHSGEPVDQLGENYDNHHDDHDQDQIRTQSSPPYSTQVTVKERATHQNPFSEMVSPYPQQGMSFSSLLMSADVPETLSPIRETVRQARSLPLLLSSQPLEQNSINSFHQNQCNFLQETHNIYQNGHIPEAAQSSNLNGRTYRNPNGYFLPNETLPIQDFQLSTNPFQLGESSRMTPFNIRQWPNQIALQRNPSLFGQRGGYEDMLTSGSDTNHISLQDSGSSTVAACFRPLNLQTNHKSVMGDSSVGPNLALNLQGPLSNTIQQGLLGNQMHLEAVGSPEALNKRKSPWANQNDMALGLPNNQNMHPGLRPTTNAVYSSTYEMMGLPIDPHFRILEELRKRDDHGVNNQQQPNQ